LCLRARALADKDKLKNDAFFSLFHGDLERELDEVPQKGSPVRAMADAILEERRKCANQGYHKVSAEPKNLSENVLMICYECDLFFGSKDGISYRVVPL